MNIVARFLILMVLVSIGGEFVAPLIAPAHASCKAQAPESSTDSAASGASAAVAATLTTPDAHQDCHHHSPFCELPGHCHSGHCGPIASFRFHVASSNFSTKHLVTDDALPKSPHLSAFKRPPIAA